MSCALLPVREFIKRRWSKRATSTRAALVAAGRVGKKRERSDDDRSAQSRGTKIMHRCAWIVTHLRASDPAVIVKKVRQKARQSSAILPEGRYNLYLKPVARRSHRRIFSCAGFTQ
jgi:hypothetical protein